MPHHNSTLYPHTESSYQQLPACYEPRPQAAAGAVAGHSDHPVYTYGAETGQQPLTDDHVYVQVEANQVAAHHDQAAYRQNALVAYQQQQPHDHLYPQVEASQVAARYPATDRQAENIEAPAPQRVEDTVMKIWADAGEIPSGDCSVSTDEKEVVSLQK